MNNINIEEKAREVFSNTKVEKVSELNNADLIDLCDATERALKDKDLSFSIGFKNSNNMDRALLEKYWQGSLLLPGRHVFVGRVDGMINSSIQLMEPAPSDHATSFACSIGQHFVAPWARGHGLAKMLLSEAEKEAEKRDFEVIRLSVREDQKPAIYLYESMGYKRWGTLDKYEKVNNKMYAGHFYYKEII